MLYSVLYVHLSLPTITDSLFASLICTYLLLRFFTSLTFQYCQLFLHVVSPVSNHTRLHSYSHSHSLTFFFSLSYLSISYAQILILHYPQSFKIFIICSRHFFKVINFRFSKAAREDTVDPETYIIDPGTYACDQIVLKLLVSSIYGKYLFALICVFFKVISCLRENTLTFHLILMTVFSFDENTE